LPMVQVAERQGSAVAAVVDAFDRSAFS
jgi:hypothetical protein